MTEPSAPKDPEAQHWKAKYEAQRERLTKLWVAYKALENEHAALLKSQE